MLKSYETKEIAQLSKEEIESGKKAFLAKIESCRTGNSSPIMEYSPLKEEGKSVAENRKRSCEYKLGTDSVFNKDHLRVCEEYQMTLHSSHVDSKLPHGTGELGNIFVSTGLFSSQDFDAGNTKADGEHLLRVMNLFIEKDLSDDDAFLLTSYRDESNSEEEREKSFQKIQGMISKDVDLLKSIFGGKAPNVIMLSSKGYHIHYQLDLSLGWTERGIKFLQELSLEVGEDRPSRAIDFKKYCGVDVDNVEITMLPKDSEIDPRFDSSSFDLKKVFKEIFDSKLRTAGFDPQCIDIGTRKCREVGFWHTKSEYRVVLMRKVCLHLCDSGTKLTKDDFLSSFKKMTDKQKETKDKALIKERKSKLQEIADKYTDEESEPREYLTGEEELTIASSSNSTPHTLTVSELIAKWDHHEELLGKKGFILCRADWLNKKYNCGFNTIGSAYVYMWEGNLFVRIRHEKKFPIVGGIAYKLFMKTTKDYQRRIKTKGFKKKLGLTLNDKTGLPLNTISNLAKVLRQDPIISDVIRYNPSTLEFRSHRYLADILSGHIESSHFDMKTSDVISGKEESWSSIKRYIEETYLFSPKSEELRDTLKIIMDCGMEFQHLIESDSWNEFLDCYQGWVDAGKPRLLDTIGSGYLDIDKEINAEAYHRNNAFFRSMVISYTRRASIFRNKQQNDTIKDENLFHIVGQGGRQGKTELFELLSSSKRRVSLEEKNKLGIFTLAPKSKVKWVSEPGSEGAELRRILNRKEILLREEISVKISDDTESLKNEISESYFEGRDMYIGTYMSIPKRYIHCSTSNNLRVFKNDFALLQRIKTFNLDEVGADGRFVCGLIPSDNLKSKPVHNIASETGGVNLGKLNRDYLLENIYEDYSRLSLAIGEAFSRSVLGLDIPNEVIGCHGKILKDEERFSTDRERVLKTGLREANAKFIKIESNKTASSEEPYLKEYNKEFIIGTDEDIESMIIDYFTSTEPYKDGTNIINPCLQANSFLKEDLKRWVKKKFGFDILRDKLKNFFDTQHLELADGNYVYFKEDRPRVQNSRPRVIGLYIDDARTQQWDKNPFLTSDTHSKLDQGQYIPQSVISINRPIEVDALDALDVKPYVDPAMEAVLKRLAELEAENKALKANKEQTPTKTPTISEPTQITPKNDVLSEDETKKISDELKDIIRDNTISTQKIDMSTFDTLNTLRETLFKTRNKNLIIGIKTILESKGVEYHIISKV
jgi:hypothetical protein